MIGEIVGLHGLSVKPFVSIRHYVGWPVVPPKMEHKTMTKLLFTLGACLLMSGLAHADTILINDDFSGSSSIGTDVRLRLSHAGNGSGAVWIKNSTSLWSISGGPTGNLSNPGTTSGVAAEGAVGQLYTVATPDTSLTQVKFEFNYAVGTGSTLYFHAIGLKTNGTPLANEQVNNTGAQGGSVQNQADTNFADINIFTGLDPAGVPGDAVSFASETGGMYSATFDLSGYLWSADESPGVTGSVGNITNFNYLALLFASDVTDNTGAGAISIDNFKVTAISSVPEPSSMLVLGGALACMATGRRRRKLIASRA